MDGVPRLQSHRARGGTADVLALESPRFEDYEQLLASYERDGLGGVIEAHGFDGFFFVAYQGLGVALWAIAIVALIAALLLLLGRANYVTGARPRWVWRLLARLSLGRATPSSLLVLAALATVLSYLMVSGVLFDLTNNNIEFRPKTS